MYNLSQKQKSEKAMILSIIKSLNLKEYLMENNNIIVSNPPYDINEYKGK